MHKFVVGFLVFLGFCAAVGLGFLFDSLLSKKPTGCQPACAGRTPHCREGKCAQCTADKHCSGSTPRCNDGVCVAAPGCTDHSACKPGEICDDGRCVRVPCKDDAGCDEPLVCNNGQCTLECTQGSDCQADQECKANRCVTKTCSSPSDCAPPFRCKNGTCEPECTDHGDCTASSYCDRGRCVALPASCSKKTDCGVGELCSQGSCVRPCVDNSLCPTGSECVDGLCVHTKLPCPPGSTLVRGVCVKTPCTADSQCGVRKCVQGKCQPICDTIDDVDPCGPNSQCLQGKCLPRWGPREQCPWPTFFVAPGCLPRFTPVQDKRMPSKADPRFLMFEGSADENTCLKMCANHQDCVLAWTNTDNGRNECTLWSEGVDKSTAAHPSGKTHHTYRVK